MHIAGMLPARWRIAFVLPEYLLRMVEASCTAVIFAGLIKSLSQLFQKILVTAWWSVATARKSLFKSHLTLIR